MPFLSLLTLRMAVLFMVGGATLGALALIDKASLSQGLWIQLFPLHIVWMVIGGFVQFTLGTAFWILPKFATGPSFYGKVKAFQLSIMMLNGGTILYTINFTLFHSSLLNFGIRLLWLVAAIAAALHFFPRVKPFQHS